MTADSRSTARVATRVLLICAVLFAVGMTLENILIESFRRERAGNVVSYIDALGAGGTVFFGLLAYGSRIALLNTYCNQESSTAVQDKSACIGIIIVGATCAAISGGLAAETATHCWQWSKEVGIAQIAVEV
ncbi:hypothetical protein V1509DRAFT_569296 [Lipomyces kononenkoae]